MRIALAALMMSAVLAFGQSADWTRNTVSLWPRFASNIFNISLTNGVTVNNTNTVGGETFRVQNQGTNLFAVDRTAVFPSDATKYFDGSGKWSVPVGSGGGTTINSSDGYIPVRGSSTTFTNSPISVPTPGVIAITTTTNTLSASGKILYYTNASPAISFRVQDSNGQWASIGTTTGGHTIILAATGGAVYIGANNNGSGDWTVDTHLSPTSNGTRDVGSTSFQINNIYVNGAVKFNGGTILDAYGLGSPEGVLSAYIGSTYRRTDGGAGASFYVKESGTGNTGWVAK